MNCKIKPLKKNINFYSGPPPPIQIKPSYCASVSNGLHYNDYSNRRYEKSACRIPTKRPDSFAGFDSHLKPNGINLKDTNIADYLKDMSFCKRPMNGSIQKSNSILNIPLLIELNNRNTKMKNLYSNNKMLNEERARLSSKSSQKIPNLFANTNNDKSFSSHYQENTKPGYEYSIREGNYPIRPIQVSRINDPNMNRPSYRTLNINNNNNKNSILKERHDLNKSINEINSKLRNMRLLSEKSNNEPKLCNTNNTTANNNKPTIIIRKNLFSGNTNINELKNKFTKRESSNHYKIPVIIEDLKSLDIILNDQQNSLDTKRIETKTRSREDESVKKTPVFIRPNVEKLLQPTLRGAPRDILLNTEALEPNETVNMPLNNEKSQNNKKIKKKFSHLNYFKKKLLSNSFISKLSDKTSDSSSSNLNCFDTDTENENHSSIITSTTSNSSKSQSSNETHELDIFRVQTEKNFFNENHFAKQQIVNNEIEEQISRINTLNKYMIRSKSLSSDSDEDENNEDDAGPSDSSSDGREEVIVPCCRIKLNTNNEGIVRVNQINNTTNNTNLNVSISNSSNKIDTPTNSITKPTTSLSTTSITTNNNTQNEKNIKNTPSIPTIPSIKILEKKVETKFRITLRKNSDNLDIITINEIRSPSNVASKVSQEPEQIIKINERSITNSIIDIPLPNEKDSFSEYSLFVDKIFKNALSSN